PVSAATPPQGDLVVTGNPAPEPALSGSQVTYTITVKNNSKMLATGVTVTMPKPAGTLLVTCTFIPAPTAPLVQTCTESAGIVTTTYPKIASQHTGKIT